MVSNDPACAKHAHLSLVHADPDARNNALPAKPVQRHICASHRFAKPLVDCVETMSPDVNVVDQQQVQPIGP
jgi:hypothetical protein